MKNKGQAALEYLMTYGWALIVIAIVVGVLIYIMSTSTADVKCSSSDPSRFVIKDVSISKGATNGGIVFQNAYSDSIGGFTVEASTTGGLFTTTAASGPTATVARGATDTISGLQITSNAGTASGTVTVSFTSASGLDHSVEITCTGALP